MIITTLIVNLLLHTTQCLKHQAWKKGANDLVYLVNTGNLAWQDAKQYCEKRSGKLLVIENETAKNVVKELLKNEEDALYWTGLSEDLSQNWSWDDVIGQSGFTDWAEGQPYEEKGDPGCGVVDNHAKWKVSHCESERRSICQKVDNGIDDDESEVTPTERSRAEEASERQKRNTKKKQTNLDTKFHKRKEIPTTATGIRKPVPHNRNAWIGKANNKTLTHTKTGTRKHFSLVWNKDISQEFRFWLNERLRDNELVFLRQNLAEFMQGPVKGVARRKPLIIKPFNMGKRSGTGKSRSKSNAHRAVKEMIESLLEKEGVSSNEKQKILGESSISSEIPPIKDGSDNLEDGEEGLHDDKKNWKADNDKQTASIMKEASTKHNNIFTNKNITAILKDIELDDLREENEKMENNIHQMYSDKFIHHILNKFTDKNSNNRTKEASTISLAKGDDKLDQLDLPKSKVMKSTNENQEEHEMLSTTEHNPKEQNSKLDQEFIRIVESLDDNQNDGEISSPKSNEDNKKLNLIKSNLQQAIGRVGESEDDNKDERETSSIAENGSKKLNLTESKLQQEFDTIAESTDDDQNKGEMFSINEGGDKTHNLTSFKLQQQFDTESNQNKGKISTTVEEDYNTLNLTKSKLEQQFDPIAESKESNQNKDEISTTVEDGNKAIHLTKSKLQEQFDPIAESPNDNQTEGDEKWKVILTTKRLSDESLPLTLKANSSKLSNGNENNKTTQCGILKEPAPNNGSGDGTTITYEDFKRCKNSSTDTHVKLIANPHSIEATIITDSGKQCIFPFIYQGKAYFDCTNDGEPSGRYWCSTKSHNYDGIPMRGFCESVYKKHYVAKPKSGYSWKKLIVRG